MDGTLLNKKQKISFLTKKYLQKLQKQGNIIVLASGRPIRELKRYYDELGLTSPMVSLSGNYAYSPYDKDFKTYEFTFDRKIAINIVDELLAIRAIDNAFCETNDHIWVYHEDKELVGFFWKLDESKDISFGPFDKTLSRNPTAMLLETKKGHKEKEIEFVISKYKGLHVRFWFDGHYAEPYFEGCSKAKTLQMIATHYHIDKDHIIAFGDQHNDIEMIKWAKIGVAMKNASEELKSHAKYITKYDNNHNGIYFALKSILKNINKN
jgi:Cof subfamily protein (haloacid dehalogenase superfamily)